MAANKRTKNSDLMIISFIKLFIVT